MSPLLAILNTLWQGALLAFLAWAAMRCFPRINAATRCAVWWAVLTLVLLVLPLAHVNRQRFQPTRAPLLTVNERAAVQLGPVVALDPLPVRPRRGRFDLFGGDWLRVLIMLWVAVFTVQTVRLALSFFFLVRLKRRSSQAAPDARTAFVALLEARDVRRRARLLLTPRIASPVAVGFFRPAVILPDTLPEQLSETDLQHVLLHEIAHIARRDDWVLVLTKLLWAVFAIHPVAAWILSRIERERELACDDWVVAATGAPRPYAQSLARLFELCRMRRRVILASGFLGSGSQLGDRIAMLLRHGRGFTARVSILRVAGLVLVLFAAAGIVSRAPAWIVCAQSAPALKKAQLRSADSSGQSFLAALVAAGYGDLPVDEIVNLKVQGVAPAYLTGITDVTWKKPSTREIIDLKTHGVSPEYVRAIRELGFGPYTPREIIDLRIQGVSPDLFRALKDYGITEISPAEIRTAWVQGLRARNLHLASRFGASLNLQQIVKLKQAGLI